MNKRLTAAFIAGSLIGIILTTLTLVTVVPNVLNLHGVVGVDLETSSVHSRIQIWRGDELILDEYHAGVVTDLGDNMTLFNVFGDADHQYGSLAYTLNATYISIGNDTGTLSSTSTCLPNEWHRENATIEDEAQSQLNLTCTISGGDIPATETADCIGLCFSSSDDADDLWAYDTFTEVSGIDNSFTITVEFQVSVSHT